MVTKRKSERIEGKKEVDKVLDTDKIMSSLTTKYLIPLKDDDYHVDEYGNWDFYCGQDNGQRVFSRGYIQIKSGSWPRKKNEVRIDYDLKESTIEITLLKKDLSLKMEKFAEHWEKEFGKNKAEIIEDYE